jgi:hypothetical protein
MADALHGALADVLGPLAKCRLCRASDLVSLQADTVAVVPIAVNLTAQGRVGPVPVSPVSPGPDGRRSGPGEVPIEVSFAVLAVGSTALGDVALVDAVVRAVEASPVIALPEPASHVSVVVHPTGLDELVALCQGLGVPLQPVVVILARSFG